MRLFSNTIYTTIFLLACHSVLAQTFVGLATTSGKIAKHTSKINYDPPPHSISFELQYMKQTQGTRYWQQAFGKPMVGLLGVANLYRDSIIGSTYVIAPCIQYDIVKYRQWKLTTRLAAGPAVATQFWQRTSIGDTFANYLGSRLNMFGQLAVAIQYSPNARTQLFAGGSLNHVSNGAIRKPNLGVNLVGVYAGVRYAISEAVPSSKSFVRRKSSWGIDLRAAISAAEYGYGNGPLLPFYYGAVLLSYKLRQKHKLYCGFDYEYSTKLNYFIQLYNQDITNLRWQSSFTSFVVGNEIMLGKFSIPMQIGVYLNNEAFRIKPFYQRFGVMYHPFAYKPKHLLHGLYSGLTLKSNGSVADYIDWQVAYHCPLTRKAETK
jgi:hypothetical protein